MNRFGKGEERGKEKSLSLTQCEKLLVIKPSPTIIASVCLLPSPTITTSVDLMLLGMECRWNERQAKRGTWERDSEIFREEKWSEQKPSNGNITWFLNWFNNTQVMGPTKSLYLHWFHWESVLSFWKHPIAVSVTLTQIFEFWVMETRVVNQAKHKIFLWDSRVLRTQLWKLSNIIQKPTDPNRL